MFVRVGDSPLQKGITLILMHTWEFVMQNLVTRFMNDESGATAIEYGLIAALISIGIIAGATSLGGNISNRFNTISNTVSNAGVTP